MSSSRARSIADVGGGTILASVDIAAAPERVFHALTDPQELIRWWGEEGAYRTTNWTSDFRVGGRWRAEGRSAEDKSFAVEGTYLEIDPPHKIVQTWKPDWDGGHETRLTYRLEEIPEGTRVIVRHDGFAGRPDSCRSHAQGWPRVLGWLSRHLDLKAARFFLCRLLPPRPTFAADMSADEAAVMRRHADYWRDQLREGRAIVFGPVGDPQGAWGLAIVRAGDEPEVQALEAGDPAIRSELGFRYETLPMLQAVY